MIVQALTDNRNRTSAEIKNIFSRNGGSFAEPGAVSWQFERKGIVQVDRAVDEDELMLVAADAGAEDVAGSRRLRGRSRRRPPSCTRCAPRSRRPGSR